MLLVADRQEKKTRKKQKQMKVDYFFIEAIAKNINIVLRRYHHKETYQNVSLRSHIPKTRKTKTTCHALCACDRHHLDIPQCI